jgi:cation diffusion facilitator CzcD-associated flavoprotein CzcO
LLARQNLGRGSNINTKFDELIGDNGLKRIQFVQKAVQAAPYLKEKYGLQSAYFQPEMVEFQGRRAKNLLYEQLAELSALEQIHKTDLTKDPELRKKLVPNHPFGCKRPLFSNLYYPIFNLPQVELVTDKIERLSKNGVVTADGVELHDDTGLHLLRTPLPALPRAEVIDEFCAAVLDGIAPRHDGAWGLGTLEACLGLLDSLRSGRETALHHQGRFPD